MKIVVFHGQNHKGSTYHTTKLILDRVVSPGDTVLEFQANRIPPCVGCFTCFMKGEEKCPHREAFGPAAEAVEEADLVVAESPAYVMGMTGQLKSLFDHFGYRWVVHRPHPSMRNKIGLAVSTTAGAGAGRVTKDIARQFFWWGIPKTYRLGVAVAALSWQEVSEKNKAKIGKKAEKLAGSIKKRLGKKAGKPNFRWRLIFSVIRKVMQGDGWNDTDKVYWRQNGWI